MAIMGQISSHLRVKREVLDFDKIQADLWVTNLDFERKRSLGLRQAGMPGIRMWEEDGEWLILPRGYPLPPLRNSEKYAVELAFGTAWQDLRPEWPTVEFPLFRRQLRLAQEPAALALINTDGDKLLCLGCGKGKTTIALWYAAQRRVKTLIIVDRDFLVDQWCSEIECCFGWTRYENGDPYADIGIVQGKNFWVSKHITVAMIHTLSQQEFDREFYDQFGLVIVDEAHMLGADTFSLVLPNFPSERLLLTATPERSDGMHPVFMFHAGGTTPCYVDISRDRGSSWYFLKLPRILSDEEEKACFIWNFPKRRMMFNRPKYETAASNSMTFNRIIVEEVCHAASAGRNVLILGSRVEQLELLASVIGEHYDTGLVTGEVKGEERRAQFSKQILFCTDKIGSRALDVPRLDTLFLLYPTEDEGFLRQTVGRIDREIEGKSSPIVVVFCHETLEKKERRMADAIHSIDSGATITEIIR